MRTDFLLRQLRSWEALDSRGRPTVAAAATLAGGARGTAVVPSGASTGSHEAVELRDGGTRYQGFGVRAAVRHVESIIGPALAGRDTSEVGAIDAALRALDPSTGFATLGANAVLAVSIACERAAAAAAGTSLARRLAGNEEPLLLPMPMVNVISGGAHAGGAIDVQDFLVVPTGASTFGEAIRWAAEIREATAAIALRRGMPSAALTADEGGLGIALTSNQDALELLCDGIAAAGFEPGRQVGIAIDVAATQLFTEGRYRLACEDRWCEPEQLVDEIASWCTQFPVVSVEDILAEDDWHGWSQATQRLSKRIQLVGDDLFATDTARLARGITDAAANSILIKPNQNGLLSGARAVLEQAHTAGYATVVSTRSGDTEDNWLADLAVGWRAGQIKVGSTRHSERTAKWNRLLELEATEKTDFAGSPFTSQDN